MLFLNGSRALQKVTHTNWILVFIYLFIIMLKFLVYCYLICSGTHELEFMFAWEKHNSVCTCWFAWRVFFSPIDRCHVHACRLFVTLSTQHVHLNNKRKGKVLFHICMMQFLRMEVYGSKKKMIYIQGSYIIYMISLRWTLVTSLVHFSVTYLYT